MAKVISGSTSLVESYDLQVKLGSCRGPVDVSMRVFFFFFCFIAARNMAKSEEKRKLTKT